MPRRTRILTDESPPRGGVVQKESVAIEQPHLKPRKIFSLPTLVVSHPKPKAERTLTDYASAASYWRGFSIGSLTMLLIGLFIGVAVTHITQIMSIPITKETMEQGAMISRLFTEAPQ